MRHACTPAALILLAIAITGTTTGCTIVPGLHVNEKPLLRERGDYDVMKGEDGKTYRVERSDVVAGFRVVEINAQTLAELHSDGNRDADEAVTEALLHPMEPESHRSG